MYDPSPWMPSILLIGFLEALPPILLGILAVLLVVFLIKSLIKFAIFAGAIALLVLILWQVGVF